LELSGLNDKVHSIGDTDGIVIGEEVAGKGKVDTESFGNVDGDEAADGGGDVDGPELGRIVGVLMWRQKK
jgi:hypothetical protein